MLDVVLISILLSCVVNATNYSQYVNLLIGTEGSAPGTAFNGGNVFPGASLPFGAVKVGIDTTE
jgi:putative alpha-1,2-mannosidase